MKLKIYRDEAAAAEQKELDRFAILRKAITGAFKIKCDDRIAENLFNRNDRGELNKKGYPQND